MCTSAEEMRYSEDQIAMESASDSSQYRSYLPPPSDFKFTPNLDDQIEELPTPEKWKSSSELRKSTARTFKVSIKQWKFDSKIEIVSVHIHVDFSQSDLYILIFRMENQLF